MGARTTRGSRKADPKEDSVADSTTQLQTRHSRTIAKAANQEAKQPAADTRTRGKAKKRAAEDELAAEEAPVNKNASSRSGKRRKQQKAVDVPTTSVADDSCPPCVEAQISIHKSPTKPKRKVKAANNTSAPDVLENQLSPACRPQQSPAAPKPAPAPQVFDASNPEHISMCLSALNMEVSTQEAPAAPVQPSSTSNQSAPHGRHKEFGQLLSTLQSAWKDGVGRSVYISGLPGTGKSHTVRSVLRSMQRSPPEGVPRGEEPLAVFVSCFGQTDASHIHAAVLNHVARQAGQAGLVGSADSLSAEQAYAKLHGYLQELYKRPAKGGSSSPRMVVVVLDEVDRLLSARTGIDNMVRLFMLPHATGVHCCVVAMANSIDITERCLPELKLRGCAPLFMPFGAYLRPQLLSILTSKLSTLPWTVFDMAALELLARKVAASTGDARKALQACRIALRALHEQHGGSNRTSTLPPSPEAPLPPITTSTTAALPPASPRLPTSPRPPVPCMSPRAKRPLLPFLDSHLSAQPTDQPAAAPTPTRLTSHTHSIIPAPLGTPSRPPLSPLPAPLPDATTPGPTPGPSTTGAATRPPTTTTTTTQPPAAPRPILVTVREMVAALSRLQYQSEGSASTVAAIRNLPQQQQLHLLALASALATAATHAATEAAAAAAAAEHGMTTTAYRAKYYWGPSVLKPTQVKLANPFAQAPAAGGSTGASTGAGTSVGGVSVGTPSRMSVGGTSFAGDTARAVPLSAAYDQYRVLCAGLYQQPASEQEFHTTQQLLSHLGLVSVVQGAPGSATKGMSTPGGGRRGGVSKSGASLSGVQLLLKVAMKDIQAALKDNAVFRKVLAVLPNA